MYLTKKVSMQYISYSQISLYQYNPREYHKKYILKNPTPVSDSALLAMNTGTAGHYLIQNTFSLATPLQPPQESIPLSLGEPILALWNKARLSQFLVDRHGSHPVAEELLLQSMHHKCMDIVIKGYVDLRWPERIYDIKTSGWAIDSAKPSQCPARNMIPPGWRYFWDQTGRRSTGVTPQRLPSQYQEQVDLYRRLANVSRPAPMVSRSDTILSHPVPNGAPVTNGTPVPSITNGTNGAPGPTSSDKMSPTAQPVTGCDKTSLLRSDVRTSILLITPSGIALYEQEHDTDIMDKAANLWTALKTNSFEKDSVWL